MKCSSSTIFPPAASKISAILKTHERFHYFFDSITNKQLLAELVDESESCSTWRPQWECA